MEEAVPLASVPDPARAAIQKTVGTGKLQKVELVKEPSWKGGSVRLLAQREPSLILAA